MTANHHSGEKIPAGQTVIVTGSSSGIGAGIAGELGAAGANVVVNSWKNGWPARHLRTVAWVDTIDGCC